MFYYIICVFIYFVVPVIDVTFLPKILLRSKNDKWVGLLNLASCWWPLEDYFFDFLFSFHNNGENGKFLRNNGLLILYLEKSYFSLRVTKIEWTRPALIRCIEMEV